METTAFITLDFQRLTYNRIRAKQNDTWRRRVNISFFSNGNEHPLTDVSEFVVQYKKKDGTRGFYTHLPDGSVACTSINNTLYLTMAPQMLTVAGEVSCSVAMMDNNNQMLQSFSFYIDVEESENEGAASDDYLNAPTLQNLVNLTQDVLNKLGDISELKTSNKTSSVAAINELFTLFGSYQSSIGEYIRLGYIDVTKEYEEALKSGAVGSAREYLWTLGAGRWSIVVRDDNGNELEKFYLNAVSGEKSIAIPHGLIFRFLVHAQDYFYVELHSDDKYNAVPAIMLNGETGKIYSYGKEIGNGGSGSAGAVGYYLPRVDQTEPGTVSFSFESSEEGMPPVVTRTVFLPKGDKGDPGEDGNDGYTPVAGVDYYTDADKAEFETYIATELAKRGQLKPEFANSVDECTDTSKLYVLPDGYIYAYIKTEVLQGGYTNLAEPLPDNTTDTAKWVNGQRFSSSGISAQAGTTVSNPIPCKMGDTIRIKGVTLRESNDRIAVPYTRISDSYAGKGISYFQNGVAVDGTSIVRYDGLENGVYQFTLPQQSVYTVDGTFRFAMPTPTDASQVIITVNEEIVEPTTVLDYAWASTGHAFVPADYESRILELENQTEKNEESIATNAESIAELKDKIENIGVTAIPEYWQTHLAEKIATVKALQSEGGKDCFSFVLIADTHYTANQGKISPLLAKEVMDKANIKYAIHVGDWQTRGCHKTKEALLAENEAIEAMFAPIRDRMLMEQGNHDGAYGLLDRDGDGAYSNSNADGTVKAPAERESYVYNLTPQELYEFAYRKVGTIGNVHFDDTGTAYYIDDTSNNVRYIGLNTQQNNYALQADGTQLYPKMWIMRFTQAQFDFLINEALVENVTNKTQIVVFAHVPTTQEIGDREVMNGVLNAFANKTSYSGSYAGVYGYDAVSVDVDFTDAKGTLVGYFHGHTHVDSVNTSKGFSMIGTRCDAAEENDPVLKAERVKGTDTEQSFDVFTVNVKDRTIYATKIGAGSDRTCQY